ncbi:hypothetical protein [Salipiger sp. PrR003]|uniref:hypothetical protein n=1 Tax=Salipiger sp. PrR003 TaxID=2706776 RepID=UPI0013DD3165|nr:hypothetical protein [Salipiger sp. PrR003]NDV50170.1 hypothetical protein [Salipiger sp. PrR003]
MPRRENVDLQPGDREALSSDGRVRAVQLAELEMEDAQELLAALDETFGETAP